jgi:hypothetical protein
LHILLRKTNTMTTNTNTPTSSASNAHNGHPAADTNKTRILRNESEFQAALAEAFAEPSDHMRWHPLRFPDPPVCAYSRKQALADGLEVQLAPEFIKQMNEDWGTLIDCPVFLTKSAIEACETASGRSRYDDMGPARYIIHILDDASECILFGWGSPMVTRIPIQASFATGSVNLNLAWSTVDVDDHRSSFTVMLPEEY